MSQSRKENSQGAQPFSAGVHIFATNSATRDWLLSSSLLDGEIRPRIAQSSRACPPHVVVHLIPSAELRMVPDDPTATKTLLPNEMPCRFSLVPEVR